MFLCENTMKRKTFHLNLKGSETTFTNYFSMKIVLESHAELLCKL